MRHRDVGELISGIAKTLERLYPGNQYARRAWGRAQDHMRMEWRCFHRRTSVERLVSWAASR
jgi:GDP-D-mannose dehydratase